MTTSTLLLAEYRRLAAELAARARAAGESVVAAAMKVDDPALQQAMLEEAWPGLVEQFSAPQATLAVEAYDELPGGDPAFKATVPLVEPWDPVGTVSLIVASTDAPRVGGVVLERASLNAGRETMIANAERESGARWYRHASANACGFCRLMAIRGAVYRSAANAGEGRKFHDHCHCSIHVVRPGGKYTEMPSMPEWRKDYDAARKAGLRKPGEIARFMDNAPTGKATLAREAREQAQASEYSSVP